MNYTEALERAKSTPVMRSNWKNQWLIFENNSYLRLNDFGEIVTNWAVSRLDIQATDWIEAPKPVDEF